MTRMKLPLCWAVVFLGLGVLGNAQSPTLIFPQIADGGGFRLEVILTNPTAEVETGSISFKASTGDPLPLVISGSEVASISYSIPPGGVFKVQTDGVGAVVKSGYATVTSDNAESQITGTVIYNFNGMDISVASAPISTEFHVFVEKDELTNSGVAFLNPNDEAISILAILLDETGEVIEKVSVDLSPGQHLAQFVDQLFSGVGPTLRGSLQAFSEGEFCLIGFRQRSNGALATLSGSPKAFEPLPDTGDGEFPDDDY